MTWDVDSRDAVLCGRLRRFVFGDTGRWNGRTYRYPGFVERPGVRYMAQSCLLVNPENVRSLVQFLREIGLECNVEEGRIGRRVDPDKLL